MSADPLAVFRVRVELEATAPVKLHSFHGPAAYALLAAAHGRGRSTQPALPDGLMPDVPEQCRVRVDAGERYALGFTLLAPTPAAAGEVVRPLLDGLRAVGESAGPNRPAWGGNFRVAAVEDLVAGTPFADALTPLDPARFDQETAALADRPRLTLRFLSPLRAARPKSRITSGHGFVDRHFFDPHGLLVRQWQRHVTLGHAAGDPPPTGGVTVADNRLVWLDVSYGFAANRTRLGGSAGRVVLENVPAEWRRVLVLGQYLRAGLATRFGLGRYRIEELGPEPHPCRRAVGLIDLALGTPAIDRAADKADLAPGRLRRLADELRTGTYQPAPAATFELPTDGGTPRRVAVTPAADRALQRAVHDGLAAGLDPLFEDASLAYRKGLSRHRAAKAVAALFADGYRWAVRADVHRFFDSVEHGELEHRLAAYLADDAAVSRLMTWVRAAAPFPGRGLPTGSPLSPLLANLFLDGFDEAVAADGGRLVRYADDFLVLTRDREEAERMLAAAGRAAADLELRLNDAKTRLLHLKEPFDFLGFRFAHRERWEAHPAGGVRAVEDLGWQEARPSPVGVPAVHLPGELDGPADDGGTLIVGPGRYPVRLADGRLTTGDGGPAARLDELDAVFLLGDPDLSAGAVRALAGRGIPVVLADERLREPVVLVAETGHEDSAAVAGQLRLAADEPARLRLARELVAAKLRNYAALADALPPRRTAADLPAGLRALADRAAAAPGFDELLGLEGTGARRWYESLPGRLPPGWHFPGRRAPAADDPVNVLLNTGYTFLHRWAHLAARAAGLLPTVGLLHRPRPGHAALASDLQEPFRHLIDRTVLELLPRLKRSDFRDTPAGRFRLTILPHAAQQITAALAVALRRGVALGPTDEPKSYRRHLIALARGLRRTLAEPGTPWPVFTHPPGGTA